MNIFGFATLIWVRKLLNSVLPVRPLSGSSSPPIVST